MQDPSPTTSTTALPEPPTPAPTPTRKVSTKSAWTKSYFHSTADGLSACKCIVNGLPCGSKFQPSTSATILERHLLAVHSLKRPEYLISRPVVKQVNILTNPLRKRARADSTTRSEPQEAPVLTWSDAVDEKRALVAITFYLNPRMSFDLLSDPYFRLCFGPCIHGLTRRSIVNLISDVDRQLCNLIHADIKTDAVSIVFDGGKDINGRKIIGSCLLAKELCYYWAIKDTERETLDADYYKGYCRALYQDVTRHGPIVISFTTDNEASQVAGLREFIREEPHLLHFRCGPHTLELIMDDIISSYPGLKAAIKEAETIVTTIRNRKALAKLVEDAQIQVGKRPLVLITFSNTRKWSSSFLVIARLFRLRQFVDFVIANNPEDLPMLNWERLAAVQAVLSPIYHEEMVLQRDRANAIHLGHSFWAIKRQVLLYTDHLLAAGEHDQFADHLTAKFAAHFQHFMSSGVGLLSQALWPTSNLPLADLTAAMDELSMLVEKQFSLWQQRGDVFHLPFGYTTTGGKTAVDFVQEATQELHTHTQMPTARVTRARATFDERCAEIKKNLEESNNQPEPAARRRRSDATDRASLWHSGSPCSWICCCCRSSHSTSWVSAQPLRLLQRDSFLPKLSCTTPCETVRSRKLWKVSLEFIKTIRYSPRMWPLMSWIWSSRNRE